MLYGIYKSKPLSVPKVYTIGSHNLSYIDRTKEYLDSLDSTTPIFPNEFETDKNEFLRPPTGITSITSGTEGTLGAIKKTTVNFIIHIFMILRTFIVVIF